MALTVIQCPSDVQTTPAKKAPRQQPSRKSGGPKQTKR